MDRLSAEERSDNMRAIRSSDTRIELAVRRALWARKQRGYRVHPKGLPGKPDVAFFGAKLAVFIDGCFWHGCSECYSAPKSNRKYWAEKVKGNRARDERVSSELRSRGWTVLRFWEHEVEHDLDRVVAVIERERAPTL